MAITLKMQMVRPQHNHYSCQSIVKKRLKMLIDTRTKSRAYGRHQKQSLWKALRFCALFCLDLASLATLCRGLMVSIFLARRFVKLDNIVIGVSNKYKRSPIGSDYRAFSNGIVQLV